MRQVSEVAEIIVVHATREQQLHHGSKVLVELLVRCVHDPPEVGVEVHGGLVVQLHDGERPFPLMRLQDRVDDLVPEGTHQSVEGVPQDGHLPVAADPLHPLVLGQVLAEEGGVLNTYRTSRQTEIKANGWASCY